MKKIDRIVYVISFPHEFMHWSAARLMGLKAKIGPAVCWYWGATKYQDLVILLAPIPIVFLIPTWQWKVIWLSGCTFDIRDALKLVWSYRREP